MKTFFQTAILSLLLLAVVSCHRHETNELAHHHHEESAEIESGHSHDKNDIIIEPETAQQFGIECITVSKSPFNSAVNLSGELLSSPANESVVSATTSGVLKLSDVCVEGASINAGQKIGFISAKNDLGDNPNAVAEADIKAAKSELDRLKPLYDDGIVTNREYQSAVSAYERAKASYSKASASGVVKALKSGTISEVLASTGEFVSTGQAIARLSSNASLLLRVDVPERMGVTPHTFDNVAIRDFVTGEWVNLCDRNLKRLDRNDTQVKAGYKSLYFSFKNDGIFSAGSFVDVVLTGAESKVCISLPGSAIIENQGAYYVYVKNGEHTYVKRKIEVGDSAGDLVEVLSGISDGDVVVIKGVNSVKMAEASGAVPEGHSHNH